jgi:hypothetical protein
MNLTGAWRSVPWFLLGLVVAGAVMAAWLIPRGVAKTDVTIRTYSVNPQIAGELRNALAAALSTSPGFPPRGQVTLAPNGRLLVSAPASVQSGVGSVIDEINNRELAPTPSMLFEAWIVSASPAGSAEGGGDPAAGSPRLNDVEPALAAIRKARGPMRFELVEKLATQARSGNEDSEVRGVRWQMRVIPTIRRGEKDAPVVSAEFYIGGFPRPGDPPGLEQAVKSMAELKPGQLLVVGQSSAKPGPGVAADSDIYYIVRATL